MLVVDASAVVELLFKSKIGEKVFDIIFKPSINLIAPELLSIETIQVIRRFTSSRELSQERASMAFQDLRDLPIFYYPHQILLDRVWELRKNFTAYDATYLALAESLQAPLLTCDSAFNKGYGKLHKAKVILLKKG